MSGTISVPVATIWKDPAAPRTCDAPAVAARPDMAAWNSRLDGPARSELHERTLTQALVGEPVEVLAERGDWAEVVLPWQPSSTDPRGYRGWVPLRHLAEHTEHAEHAADLPIGEYAVVTARVVTASFGTARLGTARCGTAEPGRPGLDLSHGTILPVEQADGESVRLRLPNASTVTVPAGAVRVGSYLPRDPASLLASARRYLGLPYLWGGTCGWAVDCSGLVHLAHRVTGVRVPRDAFDQVEACSPRDVFEAGPGDVYFFARAGARVHHVGFAASDGQAASAGSPSTMLHAPESGALVEEAPLTPERAETLVSAGTFLS